MNFGGDKRELYSNDITSVDYGKNLAKTAFETHDNTEVNGPALRVGKLMNAYRRVAELWSKVKSEPKHIEAAGNTAVSNRYVEKNPVVYEVAASSLSNDVIPSAYPVNENSVKGDVLYEQDLVASAVNQALGAHEAKAGIDSFPIKF